MVERPQGNMSIISSVDESHEQKFNQDKREKCVSYEQESDQKVENPVMNYMCKIGNGKRKKRKKNKESNSIFTRCMDSILLLIQVNYEKVN
jgi:hypothetical protein